jgi:tRNA-dihydrouridine synthase 1
MAMSLSIKSFREVVNSLAEKYRPVHEGEIVWENVAVDDFVPDYNLKLPPWICQPYYRLPPEQHKQKLEQKQSDAEKTKKKYFDKEGNAVSHKRLKKLKRLEKRSKIKIERHGELCIMQECDNTRGLKCHFSQCRICCRKKCYNEILNCSGHKFFIKDKRERAEKRRALRLLTSQQENQENDKETCQHDNDDEETSTPFVVNNSSEKIEKMRTNDDDEEHVMEES